MPLRNRATPFGEIIADPGRGTLMGNRGVLHNRDGEIVRDWQVRRWIACRLEFRGCHRTVMSPGTYTELFFLDEAAAFADGHRPCAECRHADFLRFRAAWTTVHADASVHADAIDAILHTERRRGGWLKQTYLAPVESLPDGAYIVLDGRAWLVNGTRLYVWSPGGYVKHARRPASGDVTVLTPPSLIGVFRAGYQPALHPSIDS
jgi:hypothetical protein